MVDYVQQFNFSNVFNSQNGLLQYTSIGDKFCWFEKLLIMSISLVFYLSLTLKMAYFSVLLYEISSLGLENCLLCPAI